MRVARDLEIAHAAPGEGGIGIGQKLAEQILVQIGGHEATHAWATHPTKDAIVLAAAVFSAAPEPQARLPGALLQVSAEPIALAALAIEARRVVSVPEAQPIAAAGVYEEPAIEDDQVVQALCPVQRRLKADLVQIDEKEGRGWP